MKVLYIFVITGTFFHDDGSELDHLIHLALALHGHGSSDSLYGLQRHS